MNKVTIIGTGSVGSTIAYTLAVYGSVSEIVLIDVNNVKAEGEAMDILTITSENRQVDWDKLLLILYGMIATYSFSSVFTYFQSITSAKLSQTTVRTMRNDLFKKLEKLPYTYYDNHETGKIMSRMTNDLMDVSELAHHGPENIFICGIIIP